MKYNFEQVIPEYTGGGIYLYHGKLPNGKFFLASDEDVIFLNADPSDFDVSCIGSGR